MYPVRQLDGQLYFKSMPYSKFAIFDRFHLNFLNENLKLMYILLLQYVRENNLQKELFLSGLYVVSSLYECSLIGKPTPNFLSIFKSLTDYLLRFRLLCPSKYIEELKSLSKNYVRIKMVCHY